MRRFILVLGGLAVAACNGANDKPPAVAQDTIEVKPPPPSADVVPPNGSFTGNAGDTTRVTGTATWAIEMDSLDLRRKLTIRVALDTPDSARVVLRAIDSTLVAPGAYGVTLIGAGQSHRDPRAFVGEIRANDNGNERRYLLGDSNKDTVFIDGPPHGGADSVLRGRVSLHGSPRGVAGEFVAPAARDAHPLAYATPAMQEAVLRRALDGFAATFIGATNGDGPADSTHSTEQARRFLESRWGGAAVIDSVSASPQAFYVRLRGRSVALMCEVDNRIEKVRCGN